MDGDGAGGTPPLGDVKRNNDQVTTNEEERGNETVGVWLALGIAVGLSLGVVLGLLVFDNLALGLGLGLCVGVGFGTAVGAGPARQRAPEDPPNDA